MDPDLAHSTWDPLAYLSPAELCCIDKQFGSALKDSTPLVFWTGLSPSLAQCWAKQNGLITLVAALGPLFEADNPKYAKRGKSSQEWSKYMKGASGRFAEYACKGRRAIVLTNPPPSIYSQRVNSTFRTLEEPILVGAIGGPGTLRIDYVHPTVAGATQFLYQIWPENRSNDWFTFLKGILQKEISQLAARCIEASAGKGVDKAEQQKPVAKEGLKRCPMGMAQSKVQIEKESKQQKNENEVKKTQEQKQAKCRKVEAEKKRTQKKKEAKRRAEDDQSKARAKKEAKKQQKADDERRKAQEKRDAKQRKAREELRKTLKQEIAKRKMAEEQRQAQERKAAKRKMTEEEQQKILRRKAQKKKAEDEQRQAREKKEARRRRAEGLQRQAGKKKEARQRRAEELQRQAREKKEATQKRTLEGQKSKAQEKKNANSREAKEQKKVAGAKQSQALNVGRETEDSEKKGEANSPKGNFLFGPRGLFPRCQSGQATTQPVTVMWKTSGPIAIGPKIGLKRSFFFL